MQIHIAHRRHCAPRARAVLCLLLILVLPWAPALSLAQSIPMSSAGGDAATQMPCHSNPGDMSEPIDTLAEEACAHCCSDAAVSQCQCCSHTAPAGLAGGLPTAAKPHAAGPVLTGPRTEPLTDPPAEDPFRPPILHS